MPVLGSFVKQPNDIQDFDVDFAEYLAGFDPVDTLVGSPTVTADAGVTLSPPASRNGSVVKVWVAGGTSGTTYKVTILCQTTGGRRKEVEFKVKVKED